MYQPSRWFTRFIVASYFILLGFAFCMVEWRHFTLLSFAVTLLAAVFFADFLSGLVHLTIDYFPLNYKKRLHELFFYDGDRASKPSKTRSAKSSGRRRFSIRRFTISRCITGT